MVACAGKNDAPKAAVTDTPVPAASDDTPTCANYVKALTACHVITGTRLADCNDSKPILECVFACVKNASCDEIKADYCDGSYDAYASCLDDCNNAQPAAMFVCNDGTEIMASFRCDGVPDCPGGEDEVCPPGTFTCDNGLMIPAGWKCDGVSDCENGEDERDCGPPFVCNDGTTLPSSKECDGTADCAQGEDELDCTKLTCH